MRVTTSATRGRVFLPAGGKGRGSTRWRRKVTEVGASTPSPKARGSQSQSQSQSQRRGSLAVVASTSEVQEPSPRVAKLTDAMRALFAGWSKVVTSALSNVSAKRVLFAVAAKLKLWRVPLLPFLTTGKHLIGLVNAIAAMGAISRKTANTFEGLFNNYRNAVVGQSEGVDDAKVVHIMKQILRCVFKEFVDPYEFPSYHDRILEPYDYYQFGQEYVRCMTDFNNSYIGHVERFEEIQAKLKAGENVILLANHQSEADPGVWALMLEKRFPYLAENIVYVAGDRVVSDPLCKPFSMGRNLLCVHSKKYMDEDPETKPAKMKQNRTTLSKMGKMLSQGGTLLWIAPSGGRDRPNDDGKWLPAKFDEATVALMHTLGSKAKSKTNFYPFAMWSYAIMPPPPKVVVELGEERIINFSGVGVSLAEALDIESITKDVKDDKAATAKAITEKSWEEMNKEYVKLDEAISTSAGTVMEAQGYVLPDRSVSYVAPQGGSPASSSSSGEERPSTDAWYSW
ncbi:glycerol-3-phosphate acyltransferase [Chloropicon primus]|uniref:Glycerol-3-phosphate acyltransferase n=1 Tax=Chloropicon primus TaxID=1764295 RepID=A0A5B8MGW0_9CHLO|nr:glycerol-3-phosphate acyltransferase [Chloropicon primus]|eukprot:QDZ18925.1 glycerol-3-phosphate acyltransferase [Chloropicon primus]